MTKVEYKENGKSVICRKDINQIVREDQEHDTGYNFVKGSKDKPRHVLLDYGNLREVKFQ